MGVQERGASSSSGQRPDAPDELRPAATAPADPPPPVSSRSTPRFRTRERHQELAAAFQDQGAEYDRLRPGYPPEIVDALLAAVPAGSDDAVDLGAGTGKLSRDLVRRGMRVVAVDPSRAMLDAAAVAVDAGSGASPGAVPSRSARVDPGPLGADPAGHSPAAQARPGPQPGRTGTLHALVGTAEATGLPDASADLLTAAQAWHWFDTVAACAEVHRILRPGGVLALLWNTLDVQIPWVHRYSRIMHAGDVQRDDFAPPVAPTFELVTRTVHRWEDPRTTHELIDLARTRSYVITATAERRDRVLANLDWYLHEHLGHAPGDVVGMPYRTDLFLYRPVRRTR